MDILNDFTDMLKGSINTIIDFFNNLKLIFNEAIDFIPNEIRVILLPTLIIIVGLYIYRFIR